MEEGISNGTLYYMIGISGFIISTCFFVIGFFLKGFWNQVKSDKIDTDKDIKANAEKIADHREDMGKLKGSLELLSQKQMAELQRIELMTQMELKIVSKTMKDVGILVGDLSTEVKTLVLALAKESIENNKGER